MLGHLLGSVSLISLVLRAVGDKIFWVAACFIVSDVDWCVAKWMCCLYRVISQVWKTQAPAQNSGVITNTNIVQL